VPREIVAFPRKGRRAPRTSYGKNSLQCRFASGGGGAMAVRRDALTDLLIPQARMGRCISAASVPGLSDQESPLLV